MPLTDKDIELIDRHQLATLTSEEQLQFQQRIKDAEFKAEVEYRADFEVAIQAAGRAQKKEVLQSLESRIAQQTKGEAQKGRARWIVGLVLLLAILAALFFWSRSPSPPTEDLLFAQYYEAYPNVISPLKRDMDEDASKDAYQLYQQGEYIEAIKLFDLLSEQTEESEFYRALALMATGDYAGSARVLARITEQQAHRFQLPAQWYLLLSEIKLGNSELGAAQLREILQNERHPYYERAVGLQKDM